VSFDGDIRRARSRACGSPGAWQDDVAGLVKRTITAQERWIARDLSIIYFTYGTVVTMAQTNIDWGSVPQWITAVVAVSAVFVAAIGIAVQRNVARKRAAIDFFIKTEMDKQLGRVLINA
jgi:anti-sigma-K factor RskA